MRRPRAGCAKCFVKGHDFSRAKNSPIKSLALATEGYFRSTFKGIYVSSSRVAMGSLTAAILMLGLGALTACHSYHIDATIVNHTGGAVSLLEVDYPSASFGVDALAADGTYHYRIQTRDSGPLKVLYTAPDRHQVQITGPTLYEKQEGTIDIILLPDGKAEFHPALNPRR